MACGSNPPKYPSLLHRNAEMSYCLAAIVIPISMPSIKIRKVMSDDLPAIASIHMAAFQNHFLTDLGNCFLRHYYQLILGYPSGILLVAEDSESSNPAGFVGGVVNPPAFYRSMQQKRVRLALCMIVPLIRSPNIMRRILHNQRRVSRIAGSQEIEQRLAELSSIAVHPSHKGRGIGKELVAAFTARPRDERGHHLLDGGCQRLLRECVLR